MSSLISFDKIKARHFHSIKRFIDDLWAINDGGEFGRSLCDIYPNELERLNLRLSGRGDHSTFLNVTNKERTFIYKFFDKRDPLSFSIIRISQIESNIAQNIFKKR